jgi:hypothetical protein
MLLALALLASLLVPPGHVGAASQPGDTSLVVVTSDGVIAIDPQGTRATVLLYRLGVGMVEGTLPLPPASMLVVGRAQSTFYDERVPGGRPAPATLEIPSPGVSLPSAPSSISNITVRVRYPGSAAEQTVVGQVNAVSTGAQILLAGAVAMALRLHRWDWLFHLAAKDVRAQYTMKSLGSEISSTLSGSKVIDDAQVTAAGAYSSYGMAACRAAPLCGDSPVTISLGPHRSPFAGHIFAAPQYGWRFAEALVAPGLYIPARAPVWLDVELGPGTKTYRIDARERLLTMRDGRTVRDEQTRRSGTIEFRFIQQLFGSHTVTLGSPVVYTVQTTVTLNGVPVPQPVPLDAGDAPGVAFGLDGRIIDFDSLGHWQPSGDNYPLQSYGIYSLAMFGPITPRVVPVGGSWTADIHQDLSPLTSRALSLAVTTPISLTLHARNTLLAPLAQAGERFTPIRGKGSGSLAGHVRIGNRTMRFTASVTDSLNSQYIIAVQGGFFPGSRLGAATLAESITFHFASLAGAAGPNLTVIYTRSVQVTAN